MEVRPVGAALTRQDRRTDGRTDRLDRRMDMAKLIGALRRCAGAPKAMISLHGVDRLVFYSRGRVCLLCGTN
jgi:hypothetical protein